MNASVRRLMVGVMFLVLVWLGREARRNKAVAERRLRMTSADLGVAGPAMGVVCLVCVAAVLLWPAGAFGRETGAAAAGGGLLGDALVSGGPLSLAGATPAQASEARRDDPAAVAARAASRTSFEGYDGPRAIALAEGTFGIEDPSWTQPDSRGEGHITKYLGEYLASEESPSGEHLMVSSTVPLRSAVGSGKLQPTSLALEARGGAYAPANPIVPVSIAGSPSGGTSFPSGVSIAPVQAGAPEASSVVGDRVVFPGTAPDTDYMVEPTPQGAEASWQLLGEDSPQENALRFGLPAGDVLRLSASVAGAAEVVREGETVLLVRPAEAVEADGTPLAVSYTVSGDVLRTHVDLSGSVAFPVLVDPGVEEKEGLTSGKFGNYGAYSWPGWSAADNCKCFQVSSGTGGLQLELPAGAYPAGVRGEWGLWAPHAGQPGGAGIERVDIDGLAHETTQTELFVEIGNSSGAHPGYTFNGYEGIQGESPYETNGKVVNTAMAFCAEGSYGNDGETPSHLCNETESGQYFNFGVWALETTSAINIAEITGAVVHYLDKTPPKSSRLQGVALTSHWVQYGPSKASIYGDDEGTGVAAFAVKIPPGHETEHKEVFFAEELACNNEDGYVGCPEVGESGPINFSELPTGVHELGVYAYDGTGMYREEEVNSKGEEHHDKEEGEPAQYPTLYVDHTPPVMKPFTGSLEEAAGKQIGPGAYTLYFGAEDGSLTSKYTLVQSGVKSLSVYVDGVKAYEQKTACKEPIGVPASNCYSLLGSWTMEGQKYGVGAHTVTVKARDWVGNESEQSFSVTVNEAASQAVGPGTVNLHTGAFGLGGTDVNVASAQGSLTVGRSYDSRELTKGATGPLGPQWSLSLPDMAANGVWQSLNALPNGSVQATGVNGTVVTFTPSGSGFTSPAGYQTQTLSLYSSSPVEYELSDAAGNATIFKRASSVSEEDPLYVPGTVVQAASAGGLNKMTYKFTRTEEGITEPTEVIAPYPSSISCAAELVAGCRALEFVYDTGTSAEGEGESQWGEYKGRLKEIKLIAWHAGSKEKVALASYLYDAKGRLRAEWNPQVSPALKTVYGYDSEGHVTALTAPGQETWAFTYGTAVGDANPGRLLKVTQAPPVTELWTGAAVASSEAPSLSGSPVVAGARMAVSTGKWSGNPVAYSYQWEDCNVSGTECTPILGATNANYTPTASDVGHTLKAQVSATNGDGSATATATSAKVLASEYALPSGAHPVGIVAGADGNMYYTDSGTSKIGKATMAEAITEYATDSGEPEGIALGPEHNLWFADHALANIDHITTTGTLTSKTLTRTHPGNVGIAAGTSTMYWTESEAGFIGRMNISGEVLDETELPTGSKPTGITVAAEGGIVYVAETGTSEIAKVAAGGSLLAEYKLPAGSEPSGIVIGPDGKLWFTETGTNKIATIATTFGLTLKEYAVPAGSQPRGIVVGSDKNLYYTDYGTGKIGKITTGGSITENITLPSGSEPDGIASGPDNAIWYVDYGTNKIGLVVPSVSQGSEVAPAPGTTVDYNVGLSVSGRQSMSKTEVEKWDQGPDVPAEATAIFPPDEPQGWPASNYERATIYYLDSSQHTVDVSTPTGVSAAEYDAHGDTARALSADNLAAALKEGSRSAVVAKYLYAESKYNGEGTELTETIGPEHAVKLPSGSEVKARKQVKYAYNEEGAPAGGPYRLVTETSEDALTTGKEEDKRTVKNTYSGQEGLGWKLHKPTATITAPSGLDLVHSALYSPTTGEQTETAMPGGAAKETGELSFLRSFGTSGSESEQLYAPGSVVVDAHGDVWVTDVGLGRVEEFSPTGAFIKDVGSWGTGSGQFELPRGIAINPTTKNMYVGDENNSRVDELNEKGEFIRAFGFGVSNGEAKLQTCTTSCKAGIAGAAAGQLSEPQGIAIDSSGNVWLTDYENNRVAEYTEKGEFIAALGYGVSNGEAKLQTCTTSCKAGLFGASAGEFEGPAYLAFSGGNLYVTDYANNRVEEYNSAKQYVTEFGSKGAGNGQLDIPLGITTGGGGNLYVSDYGNSRLEEFSPSGSYVSQLGSAGEGAAQLKGTEGAAISSSGLIYVGDYGNKRIDEWGPSLSGNSGAYDSQTVFYSPKTEAPVTACQNHPEWANLPCLTRPSNQPEVAGMPPLVETTYTYNIYDEPEVTKSTSGEGSEAATRTEKDEYDAAGRLKSKETTSSTGTAIPKVSYSYSETTGLPVKQSTSEESISEEYNRAGQLVSYTDGDGKTTSYEYEKEKDLRPIKITDEKGYQELTYNKTTGETASLKDSGAGTFTASYDAEGDLVSEGMPNGLTETMTRNPVGELTGLKYVKETHCSEKCEWFADQVVPSIHGQWIGQTSSRASDSYAYNEAGWLTETQETPVGKGCSTRLYAYNADGDRTSLTRRPPGTGGVCASEGGEVEEHSYDTADRLLDAGASYNPFGDITALPGSDAGGSELASSFFADGQLASQKQAGQTITYALDPARRTAATVATTEHSTTNVDPQYDGAGSTPSWSSYPTTGEWTRSIFGISGSLDAIEKDTETPLLQLANLHGDIIGTVPDSETATGVSTTPETTEYGVPFSAEAPKYGWLGASALPTELASGVTDMGARSYVPQLGRFLQPDPQPGGSANAYSYTHGNPLNETDLSGQWTLKQTSGGLGAVGSGESIHLEGGTGLAEGAITPTPPDKEMEEAFWADPPWDQITAGNEEYEEYEEWWEWEEGWEEYAAYHHGAENGKKEALVEPAVLVQPLGEEAGGGEVGSGVGSLVPLCGAGSEGPCGQDAAEEDDRGVLHDVKGGPGVCRMSGGKHCKAHKIWSHTGSPGPSIEEEAGKFWHEVECGVMSIGQLDAEQTTIGGAEAEHGELKRRKC